MEMELNGLKGVPLILHIYKSKQAQLFANVNSNYYLKCIFYILDNVLNALPS